MLLFIGGTYTFANAGFQGVEPSVEANNPGLVGLDSDYRETRPQIDLSVDYERAATLGVTIEEIGRTLETMMGGRNVTTFLQRGEEYDVIVEGERESQRSFADIENIYVRSDRSGELIPLSNLVSISEYGAAETRSVIGIVTLFGVVAATLFTLFIVPVAYDLIARGTSSPLTVEKELEKLEEG